MPHRALCSRTKLYRRWKPAHLQATWLVQLIADGSRWEGHGLYGELKECIILWWMLCVQWRCQTLHASLKGSWGPASWAGGYHEQQTWAVDGPTHGGISGTVLWSNTIFGSVLESTDIPGSFWPNIFSGSHKFSGELMYEPTKIPGAFMIQHIFSGSIHHDMLDHNAPGIFCWVIPPVFRERLSSNILSNNIYMC